MLNDKQKEIETGQSSERKSFLQFLRKRSNTGETTDDTDKKSGLSRRKFLQWMGIGGTALVVSQIPGSEVQLPSSPDKTKNSEKEKKDKARVVIVDVAPDHSTPGIDQDTFVDSSGIENVLKLNGCPTLQDLFTAIPPEKQPMADDELTAYLYDNSEQFAQTFGEKFYATWIFLTYMNEKKSHGVEVVKALRQSEAFYGQTETPKLYPSQEAYQQLHVRQFTEKINKYFTNYGIELSLTADALIPLFQKAKLESAAVNTVFNVSWLLGSSEAVLGDHTNESPYTQTEWTGTTSPSGEQLFFIFSDPKNHSALDGQEQLINGVPTYVFNDGTTLPALSKDEAEKIFDELEGKSEQAMLDDPTVNPVAGLEVREGYRKDAVQKSIQEVIQLAQAFPNDIFICAAGNIKDDLRNIPRLPFNIVIVGEWHSKDIKPIRQVYGADIYVPNGELGLDGGSSFSTPFIAETVSELLKQGTPLSIVRAKLKGFCDQQNYRAREMGNPNSTLEQANILNIDKLKRQMTFQF